MNFKISTKAENDLTRIWNYTFETWSIDQADRYIDLIFEEIEYICENPKSGKDFSYVRNGYLRTKVKSHFLFYKINQNEKQIEIIRILHQRMDIENRLK
ncbi:toxin ParE1/3/4 [Lutibacter oricola]|uniref:Toxin n=1 Tax=Lutibacter oricola TaxID=762486 RepID=A0A1H3H131_9FLAO|nr:type II toxin-antitoxin system RelE/ParE family toxin [Lutibacter oricola]SDY09097.1 toxin ParE1/3/4 [Lutibacter oricola]